MNIIWYIICFVVGCLISLWRNKRKQDEYNKMFVEEMNNTYLAMALSDTARAMEYVRLKTIMSEEQAKSIIINDWKVKNHIL